MCFCRKERKKPKNLVEYVGGSAPLDFTKGVWYAVWEKMGKGESVFSLFDFHSHILPAMDDGSRSVEQSIAMLRAEAEQGVRVVAATPHFYPHREDPAAFLERRARAEETLRAAMAEQEGLPRVVVGAEVYAFEGMSDCEDLARLTMAGGEALLVEMPMTAWSDRLLAELAHIHEKQGLTPIVAHLDRYIHRFNARRMLARLAELPVFIQVNAAFFTERSTRRLALDLLCSNRIHLLGSDCHDLEKRPPNLAHAARWIADKADPSWISWIYQNSVELLE